MKVYRYKCPHCQAILPEPIMVLVDPPIEQYSCGRCLKKYQQKRPEVETVVMPLAEKHGYEHVKEDGS